MFNMADIRYCVGSLLDNNRLLRETIAQKETLIRKVCIGGQCNACKTNYCVKVEDSHGERIVKSKDSNEFLRGLGIYSH